MHSLSPHPTPGIRRCLCFLLFALCSSLVAAPPPELTVLRMQYEKIVAERVTAPFDAALGDLNVKFSGALDKAASDAQKAGDLPAVLAIEADKKRIAEKLPLPDDDEKTPEALKKLRGIYREQFKKIDEQRTASHSSILPGYTSKLQALEVTLTKAARVDEAKEVMAYREGLKTGAPAAVESAAATAQSTAPKSQPDTGRAPRVSKTQKAANARRLVEWALANGHQATVKMDGKKDDAILRAGNAMPKGDFELVAIERPTATGDVGEPPPWEAFVGQDALRHLYLADWKQPVPASVLSSLAGLASLRAIQIASNFDGSVVDALPDFPSLNSLMLKPRPPFTGPEIVKLPGRYPNIETFLLNGVVLSDDEFAALGSWRNLSYLMFDGPASMLSPAKVQTLAAMPKLRELKFYGPQPKAFDPTAMATLKNVKRIDISYNTPWENVQAACEVPSLEFLELSGVKSLTDASWEFIATRQNLTMLWINKCEKITDAGFAQVLKMAGLTELQVTGCPEISTAAFESLGTLKKLRKLVVHETAFDDAALRAVGKNRALKELGVRKTAVTDEAVKALKKTRPDLTIDP